MSLLSDIKSYLANENDTADNDEIRAFFDAEEVSNEFQDSGRWTEHWISVFRRGDEYVALSYEVPATEYQEDSEGESEAYEVEPVEVVVIKYVKKTDY